MIRINLLPADLRRGSRISAKVLGVAFGAALCVSASLGWLGLVWFGDLGAAEAALQDATAKLAGKEKKVAYFGQLEANKKDYSDRVQTIADIGKSRRVWSKFLDELIDVINNNGNTERHLAWVDSITMKNDPAKGALVSMPCSVQDRESERVANFHEDVEASPLMQNLQSKSEPTWVEEKSKGRVPEESLRFPLALQYAPTVVDPKAKGRAPAPAPAKK